MIILQPITWDNFIQVIKLQPHESQKEFISSNLYTLAEAYVALKNDRIPPMPYAIYHDKQVIGFIMMYYEEANVSPLCNEAFYGISRLMIGKEYQGKGYGKEAILAAIEFLKLMPLGKANYAYICYLPENEVARKLYLSVGFEETGQVTEDGEIVAKIAL